MDKDIKNDDKMNNQKNKEQSNTPRKSDSQYSGDNGMSSSNSTTTGPAQVPRTRPRGLYFRGQELTTPEYREALRARRIAARSGAQAPQRSINIAENRNTPIPVIRNERSMTNTERRVDSPAVSTPSITANTSPIYSVTRPHSIVSRRTGPIAGAQKSDTLNIVAPSSTSRKPLIKVPEVSNPTRKPKQQAVAPIDPTTESYIDNVIKSKEMAKDTSRSMVLAQQLQRTTVLTDELINEKHLEQQRTLLEAREMEGEAERIQDLENRGAGHTPIHGYPQAQIQSVGNTPIYGYPRAQAELTLQSAEQVQDGASTKQQMQSSQCHRAPDRENMQQTLLTDSLIADEKLAQREKQLALEHKFADAERQSKVKHIRDLQEIELEFIKEKQRLELTRTEIDEKRQNKNLGFDQE